MDTYLDEIQGRCIQWFLILYHWITEHLNNIYIWIKNIYEAGRNANKEERWIFLDENTYPFRVRGELNSTIQKIYYPEKYILTDDKTEGGLLRRFHVVIAEIEDDKKNKIDVTEIFHRIRWSPGAAPSLFEMILLHNMMREKYYSLKELKGYKLNILDDNADEHTVELGSEEGMEKFRGWKD